MSTMPVAESVIERDQITGIVLCGGRGSRLDNQDKPLLTVGNNTIIARIEKRLKPQVSEVLISGSRNIAIYESYGNRVVVDQDIEKGPLVGLVSTFPAVKSEWVLTTPGDVPFIPTNLIELLSDVALNKGVAVPIVENVRQNLCMLLNRECREQLSQFYTEGGLAVKHWLDSIPHCHVELSTYAKEFFNINTPSDLERAELLSRELNA